MTGTFRGVDADSDGKTDGEDCVIIPASVGCRLARNKERGAGKIYSEGRQGYHRMDDIVQTGEMIQSSRAFTGCW